MRDVNIIDFRNNMTKELESLPFRITKRTKVIAVVGFEDKTDEVQSLNKELEEKQVLIEKLKNENANLSRGKHPDVKVGGESLKLSESDESVWGDLRERLGFPREVPEGMKYPGEDCGVAFSGWFRTRFMSGNELTRDRKEVPEGKK